MKTAKDLNWDLIQWMEPEEFNDPDYPGSWQFMDAKTVLLSDWLRKNTGWPLVPHTKYGLHGAVWPDDVHLMTDILSRGAYGVYRGSAGM